MKRREFMALALALAVAPWGVGGAQPRGRKAGYTADVGLLYDTLTLHLTGTMDEAIDPTSGRYEVRIRGQGAGIANVVESSGTMRGGRWAPVRTHSWFDVRGRESRTDIAYDYGRRLIEYHHRSETFFLRRRRVVDDVLSFNEHVDDVISALLNYADGHWAPEADKSFRTQVVRRKRGEKEGPDDVEKTYRIELVPFVFRVAGDPVTGKETARFDLTRFSSWAREDRPAVVVFGADRRPELITSSLILGTSMTIRFNTA